MILEPVDTTEQLEDLPNPEGLDETIEQLLIQGTEVTLESYVFAEVVRMINTTNTGS